jgi:hypothetical protein
MEGQNQFAFLTPEVRSAFSRVVEPRLLAGEDLYDVLIGTERLGLRRAELHSRAPWPLDVEFALAMWCWWPFKPELPEPEESSFFQLRAEAFNGAARGNDRFMSLVPNETLLLSLEQLYAEQQDTQLAGYWLRRFDV